MAKLEFDANEVEPQETFEVLPAGEYVAAITASENKKTKAGTGEMLSLTWTIVAGPHKGRLLWSNLNLANPSEIAVRIARAELSAICRAVGVMQMRDSVELHNLPITIKVGQETRKDTGELKNVIKGYKKRGEARAPETQAEKSTPVWKR